MKIDRNATASVFALMLFAWAAPSAAAPVDAAKLKTEAFARIDAYSDRIGRLGDAIFSYSEIGFEETKTTALMKKELEAYGFKVETGIGGMPTAYKATYGSGSPVIGLMSESDGIPGASQRPTSLVHDPVAPGAPGHGEGHSNHQPTLMGAAVGVKAIKDKYKLPGTIVVYGGPAEELLASRGYMVKAGAFEGVDAIMHVHVGSGFSVKYGYDNFGNISVEYRFKGQPAPDTDPLRGRSALDAAELFDTGMQYMREHGFDPEDARVQSVITEGGEQPNMVPGEVANWYFIRARTPALVQSILGWMREVAKNAAGMTRTEYSERILSGSWPFNANKALAEVADRNIQLVGMPKWSADDVTFAKYFQKSMGTPQIGLRTKVEPLEHSSGHAGTSDIGDMAWHTPNVKIFMPSTIPGALAGHHWSAAVGPGTPISHKGMTAAAKVLAGTMIDLYTDPALVAGIKADFAAQIAAYPKWYSFIPDGAKPPTHINVEEMAKYRAALKPYEYDPNSKQTYLQFMKAPYPGPEPVAGAGRASNEPRTTFDDNSIGFEWKP